MKIKRGIYANCSEWNEELGLSNASSDLIVIEDAIKDIPQVVKDWD